MDQMEHCSTNARRLSINNSDWPGTKREMGTVVVETGFWLHLIVTSVDEYSVCAKPGIESAVHVVLGLLGSEPSRTFLGRVSEN